MPPKQQAAGLAGPRRGRRSSTLVPATRLHVHRLDHVLEVSSALHGPPRRRATEDEVLGRALADRITRRGGRSASNGLQTSLSATANW
jgi:hypothetical protein